MLHNEVSDSETEEAKYLLRPVLVVILSQTIMKENILFVFSPNHLHEPDFSLKILKLMLRYLHQNCHYGG